MGKSIVDLKFEQERVQLAPLPAEDLKVLAADYVAASAARAAPAIVMKDGLLNVYWLGGGSIPTPIASANVFAILCRVVPEAAKAVLNEAIDAMPKTKFEPLSVAERERRLFDLESQLDRLERQEEAVIEALHEEGSVNVTRRPIASPLAVLGVRFAKKKAEVPVHA